jgi:hypothetical protein
MTEMKQDRIALDRSASVRRIDEDGHLHVSSSVISAAAVNPYNGSEIPDYEALGLDANRVYQLFRDPAELEKAAPSFANKPLLIVHKPQTADAHDHELVVGSVANPVWDSPNLKAELVVWDKAAIDAIESGAQRDLSCGYRYRCVVEAGTYQGQRYDAKMVDLVGNHVAIVESGRVRGAFVGDSKPASFKNNQEITMVKNHASRQALLASGALSVYLRPKMAQDQKIDLRPVLAGVNGKNWATSKPKIKTALDRALKGKLAADADISDIIDMLDQLEDMSDSEVDAAAEDEKPEDQRDGESDEDYAERKKAEALKSAAKDKKGAKDKEPDMPEAGKAPVVTKAAMDAAIASAVAKASRDAEANAVTRMNAIAKAKEDVRPHVGAISGAMDSASAVYKLALDGAQVDLIGVPEAAYEAMVRMLPPPGETKATPKVRLAADAASTKAYVERFPNANRLVRS